MTQTAPLWRRLLPGILIVVLAIAGTILSLWYVQPAECLRICDEPAQAPCPPGTCYGEEQRAGFPLPVLRDEVGGSPIDGWGKLGPEDVPIPAAFVLNVLFYIALFWLLWRVLRLIRARERQRELVRIYPLLAVVGVGLLIGFGNYRPRPVPQVTNTTGAAASAIVGNWRTRDENTGQEYTFRFYEYGRASLSLPRFSDGDQLTYSEGEYRWINGSSMRFILQMPTWLASDGRDLCADNPSFLKDACRSSTAYPTFDAGMPGVATPTAAPYPTNATFIDETVSITIDGDTLLLTRPSGPKQSFRRVTNP